MTNFFLFLSTIAAGSFEVILCLFLISLLLSVKLPDWKGIALSLIVSAIALALFIAIETPGFYPMALKAILITVCANRLQKADARMSLFVGIFYEIAVAFWHFLLSAWLGVLFHTSQFLDKNSIYGQLVLWLFLILLTIFIACLHKCENLSGKNAFKIASVIALTGFIAVVSLSEQTRLTIEDDTLDLWTILSIVLMMAILIFNMNRQYEMQKELANLKVQQAELLERDYTTLNHAYSMNARLFHDFHNHIGVLQNFLVHHQTEDAIQYLNELQAPVKEMTDTIWTGDKTIDYLINSKAAEAKSIGIPFGAQVEFPCHTNLRSADLCAILGNLLDNAIDAAKKIPDSDKKWIQLTIRRINQMLVIKVENSFTELAITENGSLQSTKEKSGLHGWGLKSAKTAAEKYDGMIQTSYTNNTFRAVATLSFHGVRQL